ncbi:AI-2E family transporter [Bellilinea sp.]
MTVPPTPQTFEWTFRRIMGATLVFAIVALSFFLFYRFYQAFFALFIAILLGTVIRPFVGWLNRRGLPRIGGVILVFLLLLAVTILFVLLLFPLILEQGTTIVGAVPGYYQNLRDWISSFPDPLVRDISEFLPATLPGLTPIQQTGSGMLIFAGQAAVVVSSTLKLIFLFTAILLLAFHWTLEGSGTIQSLLLLVPKVNREKTAELISAIESKVGSYFVGQIILCLVIGVVSLVVYMLLGLPNALVLALVAGLLEAVPMIGPFLGAIPAGVVALSIAPSKLIWVVVATLVIQQLESIFLVPRVMRKAVGVNPFVSLLAIFAFSTLFGIAGALMAIPIAAIIQLLLNRYVFHPSAMAQEPSVDRNYASRLRYEAQDLAHDLQKQARLKKTGSTLRVKQIDHVMDEIETITTDLDTLLAQIHTSGAS